MVSVALYEGTRLLAQKEMSTDGCSTLQEVLEKVDPAAAVEASTCEVCIRDSGGLWRDVTGPSPLQQDCAAAGVAAAEAIRFRLPDATAAPGTAAASRPRGQAEGGGAARRRRWARRAVSAVVFCVKAVLVLEAAGWAWYTLADRRRGRGMGGSDSSDDPADVLMSYLTGVADESALMRLNTEQMADAVDALGTSDWEELGVEDEGAELRAAVEDMIIERKKIRAEREAAAAAPAPAAAAASAAAAAPQGGGSGAGGGAAGGGKWWGRG